MAKARDGVASKGSKQATDGALSEEDWKDTLKIPAKPAKPAKDIDRRDQTGCTPLYHASREGHTDIVRALLAAGASPNVAENAIGASPLYIASLYNKLEVVKMLLEAGADPSHALTKAGPYVPKGATPLWIAAQHGLIGLCRMLIENGALLNKADEHGTSPLLNAMQSDQFEVARLLIRHGADVNQMDRSGASPLALAALAKDSGLTTLMLKRGGHPRLIPRSFVHFKKVYNFIKPLATKMNIPSHPPQMISVQDQLVGQPHVQPKAHPVSGVIGSYSLTSSSSDTGANYVVVSVIIMFLVLVVTGIITVAVKFINRRRKVQLKVSGAAIHRPKAKSVKNPATTLEGFSRALPQGIATTSRPRPPPPASSVAPLVPSAASQSHVSGPARRRLATVQTGVIERSISVPARFTLEEMVAASDLFPTGSGAVTQVEVTPVVSVVPQPVVSMEPSEDQHHQEETQRQQQRLIHSDRSSGSNSKGDPPQEGEKDSDRDNCPVCFEAPRNTFLMPCGHVICRCCSDQLELCPICRVDIKGRFRVYL